MTEEQLKVMEVIGELQVMLLEETGESRYLIGVDVGGTNIINPCFSECLRFEVDPVKYYGEENVKDFWDQIVNQKIEWKC